MTASYPLEPASHMRASAGSPWGSCYPKPLSCRRLNRPVVAAHTGASASFDGRHEVKRELVHLQSDQRESVFECAHLVLIHREHAHKP